MITNAAETKFWVGDVTASTASDGGIYSGASLTSMAIMVAATYRVTGLTLSSDEATLYFTARQPANALYSVAASCTSACVPTLVLTAAAGSESRGVALTPVGSLPSATPSITPTGTPTTSPTPSKTVTPSPTSSLSFGATPSSTASPLPLACGRLELIVLPVGA